MNLVFVNSLEKRMSDGSTISAQVSIGEIGGKWQTIWRETGNDGIMRQTCWFSGCSWEEMLPVFKIRIQEKRREGFVPVLERMLQDSTQNKKDGESKNNSNLFQFDQEEEIIRQDGLQLGDTMPV